MKKSFTFSLLPKLMAAIALIVAICSPNFTRAQNIAPSATCTGFGGGQAPYQWNTINDLNLGTCGTQTAFVWTASPPNGTEYMQWDWSTAYPINKIVIHHADVNGRFLTGGTIQSWNGASWVNHFTFSGLPQVCINTITFPIMVTSRMRIANLVPGTGQNSNMNYREIEVHQGALPGTHATVTDIYSKLGNCGGTNDSLTVEVQNVGVNNISNFWVGARYTGTINGVSSSYNDSVQFNGTITTANIAKVSLAPMNTLNGANLNVIAWVRAANDTSKGDDTLKRNMTVLGSPTANPSPSNGDRCGSGSVPLTGGAVSGNTVFWYDQAVGGKLVGIGNNFKSPHVPAPTTVTYYAAGAKISGDSSLSTGFTGNYNPGAGFYSGNMFDVKISKPITIDSLFVNLNLTTKRTVSFYMKTGSYQSFTTTPNAWTLVHRGEVTSKGAGVGTPVVLTRPLELAPGNYAFYIYANEQMVSQTQPAAAAIVGNTAITTYHGIHLTDTFRTQVPNTAPNVGFTWKGSFFYHESCPAGTRIAVTATAKPLAVGATFAKGTKFDGVYDAGTTNQPDIIANPDEINYSITPPTGFTNGAYGTTWSIVSSGAKTVNGSTLPGGNLTLTNPSSSNANLQFKPAASYTDSMVIITLVIRNLNNGCDTTLERYVYVAPRPKADFTHTTACAGDQIDFTNGSTLLKGTMTYYWDFKDNTSSDDADPSHVFIKDGTYNVTLTVISNFGYKDSMVKAVQVYRVPTANFDFSNACEGAAITLRDASSLPTGLATYSWTLGDGSANQTGSTASRLYATPGIYPVTMRVSVNGCTDEITKYVTQAPRGVASFTADLGNCDNAIVKFNSTATMPEFGSYNTSWNFGDASSATGSSAIHTYGAFKTYRATMYAKTDLGCVDSASQNITLKESPKAAFTNSGASCTNENISFTNTTNVPVGGPNTYSWNFGDANTTTVAAPVYQYAAAGTYTITLEAFNSNGCSSKTTSTITIGEKPIADYLVNKVCLGKVTEFKNNSVISTGTLSYQWDLGNGSNPTTTDASVTYTTAGNYNTKLITTSSSGCSDTAVYTAIVADIPSASFSQASNGTGDGTIKFAALTSGLTYKWIFGATGASSTLQNPSYTFPINARYNVVLQVTSPDGCTNTSTQFVFVNTTGVDETQNNQLSVYPNPSTGLINISLTSEIAKVNITNILGTTVATFVPENAINETQFDLAGQPSGVYFINITGIDGKTYTQKISLVK